MRKVTTKFSGTSWLFATSLAATLAVFGCSSNQYAGNGQPTSVMPTINSVNHSGTPGSSSGTEGLRPMASSYVNPSASSVDVDALAILAAERGFRGVILGPVNPGGHLQGVTIASGQFVSPANAVYPQSTVNSSINSGPTEVITGGNVGAGINIAATGTPTGMTSGPMTASTAGTTTGMSATTGALTSTGAGTTVAGSATFSPVLMNSTPAPQATGATTKTAAASTARSTTSSGKTASRMTTATTNVNVASGIQIQNANGAIMVTNVAKTAPAVKGK